LVGLGRWLRRASQALLLAPLALALVEVVGHVLSTASFMPVWHAVCAAALVGAPSAAILGWLCTATRTGGAARVRVEADDLVIDRGPAIDRVPLGQIRSGAVVPKGQVATVELEQQDGRRLYIEVPSVPAGERLLEATKLDAAHRRCVLSLGSPGLTLGKKIGAVAGAVFGMTMLLGIAVQHLTLSKSIFMPAWLVITTVLGFLAARAMRAPELTVGTDGLVVRGPWTERSIPYAELDSVAESWGALVLSPRRGKPQRLARLAWEPAGKAKAVALRVQEAMAARDQLPAEQSLALLERGGRTVEQWRQSLAGLLNANEGYRTATLSAPELAELAAHPAAPIEQRLGAAMALGGKADEPTKARLRVAAECCASPRLRIAMEKLAEGEFDHDAVEQALAEQAPEASAEMAPVQKATP